MIGQFTFSNAVSLMRPSHDRDEGARLVRNEPSSQASSVVVLVGLAFEARIAEGPGAFVICRATECELMRTIQLAVRGGCRSIISFGVAGGLAPHLQPGDCVVASAVVDSHARRPTDALWSRRLLDMVPSAHYGPMAGVNAVVFDPVAKQELHRRTGAMAVDMESHLVARVAAAYGLAFATLRVVVDPAHRALPGAAQVAMRSCGSIDVVSVVRELIGSPSQILMLLRIASDAYIAHCALLRLRRTLGPAFGVSAE